MFHKRLVETLQFMRLAVAGWESTSEHTIVAISTITTGFPFAMHIFIKLSKLQE
jgi:hypothetical protein